MANQSQLYESQGLIKSPNTFQEYLKIGVENKWIELVGKDTIKDEKERKRLNADSRAKIYRWVE